MVTISAAVKIILGVMVSGLMVEGSERDTWCAKSSTRSKFGLKVVKTPSMISLVLVCICEGERRRITEHTLGGLGDRH